MIPDTLRQRLRQLAAERWVANVALIADAESLPAALDRADADHAACRSHSPANR
jgi:hypothetical protein